jgi:putative glycosyltransferase
MRLLIVTSHFYPENFKCNDMAFELARRGHEVTIMAPIPDYPQGRYFEGYGIFKRRREMVNGVDVIRTFVIPRRDGGAIRIALNYLSHTLFSSIRALRLAFSKRKFDAVIVHETSPVLIAIPAVIFKKIRKIPLHFWILDLWPESLEAAGGIKNRKVINFFGNITRWLYRNSDTLLTGSKGYRKSINRLGKFDDKIIYFPNWVEDVLEHPRKVTVPDLPEGFNVLIAGNMGDAQDLPHVMEAARRLDGKGINFILAGGGRKKGWVEDYIDSNRLTNVHLIGSFPLQAMPSLFAKANVLFMALKDTEVFSLTVPSRLQAYMAAGKPVVAMINGEGADLINEVGCGWNIPAESPEKLSDLLLELSKTDPSILIEKGEKGKKFCSVHFNFKQCMDNLISVIQSKSNS